MLLPFEKSTVELIENWNEGLESFSFPTSGSVGAPKMIRHTRSVLAYSAETTLDRLQIQRHAHAFACLDPAYIGGAMVVIRSLVGDLDLTLSEPTSLPNPQQTYALTSLVPLQVKNLLDRTPEVLSRFGSLLIGGAALAPATENALLQKAGKSRIYATYGMTETASHIALRKVGERYYQPLGDIAIDTNSDECLRVRGTLTNNKWLQTTDLVQIENASFEWLGRADFVINTGGYKVSPERIERAISSQLDINYLIIGLPDSQLGERVVLLLENTELLPLDFAELHRYERPRELLTMDQFEYTGSGKINRRKTRQKLLRLMGHSNKR